MKKSDASKSWYIFGEYLNLPWSHSCYNFGLALDLKKRTGFGVERFAADFSNGAQRQYMFGDEWQEAGKKYLQAVIDDPKILKKDLNELMSASADLFKFNKKLSSAKTDPADFQQAEEIYREFHGLQHEVWVSGMIPNLLELNQSYLADYLRERIFSLNPGFANEDWFVLISPTEKSWSQKEEIASSLLVKKIKRKGVSVPVKVEEFTKMIKKDPEMWQAIKDHHDEYRWIQYGWTGPAPEITYFVERIWEKIHKKIDLDDHLLAKQAIIEKRLKIDLRDRELLSLLREILFSKSYRVEAVTQGYFLTEPIARKVADGYGLSLEQLYSMYWDIFEKFKAKELTKEMLDDALTYSAFVKEGSKLNFYVGLEAKEKMKEVMASLGQERAQSEEVIGKPAFYGKASGKVRLVMSSSDNDKIKKGDILVSYATDPSLVPAMQKAAAFITDMGGLTCHAAIIAREMKKPCIVGTKNATKILKDGDLVEVDADNGTVRLIKNVN